MSHKITKYRLEPSSWVRCCLQKYRLQNELSKWRRTSWSSSLVHQKRRWLHNCSPYIVSASCILAHAWIVLGQLREILSPPWVHSLHINPFPCTTNTYIFDVNEWLHDHIIWQSLWPSKKPRLLFLDLSEVWIILRR